MEQKNVPLYPYQQRAVEQFKKVRARLNGDEMGTGKTRQGLALDLENRILANRNGLKTLIIAPKSVLLSTWVEHLQEFVPHIPYYTFRANSKPMRERFIHHARTRDEYGGYFLINWEALRLSDVFKSLTGAQWFHIIADEVHRAKNRHAKQTKNLKKLKTYYKTGLTGTPADDKPQDLWSILNWLYPDDKEFSSYWRFFHKYIESEVSYGSGGHSYHKVIDVNKENLSELHTKMKPFFVRRLKDDVLDLPEKYHSRLWVDLSPKQRKAYDELKKEMLVWLEANADAIDHDDPLVALTLVARLQRLQQFAIGYLEFLEYRRVKIPKRLWVDPNTPEYEMRPFYKMVEPSSKLDALMELIEDNENEQIVVFSQFRQVIDLLAKRLESKEISFRTLTGQSSDNDRASAIKAFQSGDVQVFAATIKAGGVGVTLHKASTVVFIDRDWSPSANRQAEDRLHRIGQKNNVHVISLMARNTVDMGKEQKLIKKAQWIKEILGD
jgi:SNF2 family DNA or RNA helicase